MGFWEFLWAALVVFFFAMFLSVFIGVIADVFRSSDLSGWGKAGWFVLLLALPVVGVLIYTIARGPQMAQRNVRQQVANAEAIVAATGAGAAQEIAMARQLLDANVITPDEFEQLKKKALA